MKKTQIAALASLLKSIAHPFRLEILCLLQDREMTVGEISKVLQTSDANVSQHLAILRRDNLRIDVAATAMHRQTGHTQSTNV